MKRFIVGMCVLAVIGGCSQKDSGPGAAKPAESVATKSESSPTPSPAAVSPAPSKESAPKTPDAEPPSRKMIPEPAPTTSGGAKPLNPMQTSPSELKKRLSEMKVPETSQNGWVASDLSPENIAGRVDSQLASSKGVYGEATVRLTVPQGAGKAQTKVQIQDRNNFQVEYLDFSYGQPVTSRIRASGGKRARLNPPGPKGQSSWIALDANTDKKAALTGSALTKAWPVAFPKLLFGSLTSHQSNLTNYVAAAKANGLQVSAQKRVIMTNGNKYVDYRILSSGSNGYKVEMVFDAHFWLPVTIRSTAPSPQGPTDILWSAGWNFGQKFDSSLFEVPKIAG